MWTNVDCPQIGNKMYAKVFRSIFDGSLYGQFEATIVFLAMLVLADKDGTVDMTAEKIAAECGYPLDIVNRGIAELEKPDPRSRTPDEDGRRIVTLHAAGWGWHIVNYSKYREIRSTDERREYFRLKKQEQRAAKKDSPQCPQVSTARHPSEADSVSHSEAVSKKKPMSAPQTVVEVFEHWKSVHKHPSAKLDAKRQKLIAAALISYSVADLCQSITGYRNSPHHMGQNDKATIYDDIELMLRDAKHIDAGMKFGSAPPRTELSSLTRKNVASTADWVPPEMRNAAV